MRSDPPFFSDEHTEAAILAVAQTTGLLTLYCGAGVTIDRTGHSWASLVLAGFPQRHRSKYPHAPTQKTVKRLASEHPDQLASSLVRIIREAEGSGTALQRALRNRFRRALYGNPSEWQRGGLVQWLIGLTFFRSLLGFPTQILTTNYDDYIEREYDNLHDELARNGRPAPGIRVTRAGSSSTLRIGMPLNIDPDRPGASIDLTYLHGRLPERGRVNWPLILDENSYASSAEDVEQAIADAFHASELALMIGTSLSDTPLIRALSTTRDAGAERRISVLTRGQFAHSEHELEALSLELARHRASELRVTPLFPDFNGQAAQFMTECALRTGLGSTAPTYSGRLERWWDDWRKGMGSDPDIPSRLRTILANVLPLLGCDPDIDPLTPAGERHQLELWVRMDPSGTSRSLTRWARSLHATATGPSGKTEDLNRTSYLAPIRAFVEGRPQRFDIADLEQGRDDPARYTWRSFLCVPIRHANCIVGVLSLASTLPLRTASITADENGTAQAVEVLTVEGTRLLSTSRRPSR